MNWTKLILLNALVLSLIITFLELSSALGRYLINMPVHIPFDQKLVSDVFSPYHPCTRMKTDVLLDHAPDHQGKCSPRNGSVVDEYVVHSWDESADTVLTLGGSTTSSFFQHISDGYTWPHYLGEYLGKKYNVINGGVGGYSSLQETLKFVRDGARLKNVKYVISLNGINDTSDYHGPPHERSSDYPFLTQTQHLMNTQNTWIDQSMSKANGPLPNFSSLLRWLTRSPNKNNKQIGSSLFRKNQHDLENKSIFDPVSFSSRWRVNVTRLNALVELAGGKYYVFLQPTMGLRGPQSTAPIGSSDAKILSGLKRDKAGYVDGINKVYDELRKECSKLNFCVDISNEVAPSGNVYNDPRHHNRHGNIRLAKIIFFNVFQKIETK